MSRHVLLSFRVLTKGTARCIGHRSHVVNVCAARGVPGLFKLVPKLQQVSARFQHSTPGQASSEEAGGGSRRRTRHEDLLVPVILRGLPLSPKEWAELKFKAADSSSFMNEHNADGIIMGLCIAHKQLEVGRSLVAALRVCGGAPNIATLSRFLRLVYTCREAPPGQAQKPLEPTEEAEVLEACAEVRALCPVLDASTAENLIYGLACTSRWRDGLELMADIKLSATPNSACYSVLAAAAFDADDQSLGWHLIEEALATGRQPTPVAWEAWVRQAWRAPEEQAGVLVGQLLGFWAEHDIRPCFHVVQRLRSWFEHNRSMWEGCFTTLSPAGRCLNCHTALKPRPITEAEFSQLRSEFLQRAVLGSSVYIRTDPEELEGFQQFLDHSAPFSVVVDGLNVAYASGSANPYAAARNLESVVRQLAGRNQRVLVLGRRHMQKWPKDSMDAVGQMASLFLAKDISQDDPLLLYAAMHSGLRTRFLSRDQMRGHAFLLQDPALRRVFRRWQHQRQMQLLSAGPGRLTVRPPLSINPSVQQGPGAVWHVPYDQVHVITPHRGLEPPRHWLCLQQEPVHLDDSD